METAAAFSAISPNCAVRPRPDLKVGVRPLFSNARIQPWWLSISHLKLGYRKGGGLSRMFPTIRASMQPSDSGHSPAPIAPLKLESPIGQFLTQILVSHPHLVPAAVEQQLEQLQTDRDTEQDKEDSPATGTELVLYRRIAEVKANERKKALEEILYALVVQKFVDAKVPLIPSIRNNSGGVDTWSNQDDKLERLHSSEAYEMIQNHLTLILGNRLNGSNSLAEISKLRVGQVYAASVMYGYFLKRIDHRFQLEKSMKILPEPIDKVGNDIQRVIHDEKPSESSFHHPEVPSGTSVGGDFIWIKPFRLRTYVMSFDGETLQRYAAIRSKEAISIIEKHMEAMFGRPQIVITPQGTVDSSKDEAIKISVSGLRRLVLEAVTFGSFLWDVESYVDWRYHFVLN